MYIGEIASLTGASPKAVRHYESLGLLGDVRRLGVYRVYGDGDVSRVRLIRQALSLGFRLSELAPALQGASGEPDWVGLLRQIELKRSSVRAEILRLQALDGRLGEIGEEIGTCLGGGHGGEAGRGRCAVPADGVAAGPLDSALGGRPRLATSFTEGRHDGQEDPGHPGTPGHR